MIELDPLDAAECARIPRSHIGGLATLRIEPGVRVALQGDSLWVRWPAGNPEIALRLFALEGSRLFSLRDGRWHGLGKTLPAFDVPELEFRPLGSVLFPRLAEPIAGSVEPPAALEF